MIVHIFNGDALAEQMPRPIGHFIVIRECLIEGPVTNESESEFWKERCSYLERKYPSYHMNYNVYVRDEIKKIKKLLPGTELCLWFEFDLFCQINMWFIIYYILSQTSLRNISWARPNHNKWSGFGKMNRASLKHAFTNRLSLSSEESNLLKSIWQYYKSAQYELIIHSETLNNPRFPKLRDTVLALLQLKSHTGESSVVRILKNILATNPNADFRKIFQLFSAQAGIYGLGDAQVKNILNTITT